MQFQSPTRAVHNYSRIRLPWNAAVLRQPSAVLGATAYAYFIYMLSYCVEFAGNLRAAFPRLRYVFPRSVDDGKYLGASFASALRFDVLLFALLTLEYLYVNA
jgi:hypothetical protein